MANLLFLRDLRATLERRRGATLAAMRKRRGAGDAEAAQQLHDQAERLRLQLRRVDRRLKVCGAALHAESETSM